VPKGGLEPPRGCPH